MELSHRVVMVSSAQVQRQTNKTASEMSSCLKFKSLPSLKLFKKSITTIRLRNQWCVWTSRWRFRSFRERNWENVSCCSENLIILNFFKCLRICQYTDQFGELSFDLSWNLIAPSTSFLLKPLNPVPIIPSALARNLSGVYRLYRTPRNMGFSRWNKPEKYFCCWHQTPK